MNGSTSAIEKARKSQAAWRQEGKHPQNPTCLQHKSSCTREKETHPVPHLVTDLAHALVVDVAGVCTSTCKQCKQRTHVLTCKQHTRACTCKQCTHCQQADQAAYTCSEAT
eukprot:1157633-Pelagomonas_calceolata.AAC.6